MSQEEKTPIISNSLNCSGCGAVLHFEPGTQKLKCDHCGATNDITDTTDNPDISAYDYDNFLDSIQSAAADPGMQTVRCNNCGSTTVLPANVTADKCPFCSSPLVIDLTNNTKYVRPHYILPFAVSQEVAKQDFLEWLKKLSFAPADLIQKVTNSAAPIDGVYLPYWAFDVDATTNYEGMRGDWYYEIETYVEVVDGEEVMREREVRHTNWFPVFGTVINYFRNMVISASKSVEPKTLGKLGSYDFGKLVNYDERYVSGFRSETYQTTPADALEVAKNSMSGTISQTIYRDIGGDEQQISGSQTQLDNIGIKYLLLPVWISTYVYKNKPYQFAINGYTGKVSGKRPWSPGKIVGLVVAILIVLILIFLLLGRHKG